MRARKKPRPTAKLGRVVSIDSAEVPQGKARPRMAVVGGHARVYTPKATVAYEAGLRSLARAEMRSQPPTDEPVKLHALVRIPVPPSWSQKKQRAAIYGEIRPTGRPDLDNYLKAICDSLNGVVFWDDAQIVHTEALKYYDARPGMLVHILPLPAGRATPEGPALREDLRIDALEDPFTDALAIDEKIGEMSL